MTKSDNIRREVVETFDMSDYEVLTDDGFKDAVELLVVEPQKMWVLATERHCLKCAGDHVVFRDTMEEAYVRELKPGDMITTDAGAMRVKLVAETEVYEEMYDVHVDHPDHRLYTGGILSHNSLVLGNIGVRACLEGSNVCIVSVELGDCKYVKRVGANLLNIPLDEYKRFKDAKSVVLVSEKVKKLKDSGKKVGQFVVKEFPTGVPSSIDIENYVMKQEQKRNCKFDIVIVDYLNLLRPYKSDATLYEKIKNIAQELRAIAQRNKWTVVSATQVKVQDYHADLRLDSVSESSGLTATVDSLFGITGLPGDPMIRIKNIANRDEGYMESYKQYKKVFEFFRLEEDNTSAQNEYWSDQLTQLDQEMEDAHNEIHGEPVIKVEPNYDFENQKNEVNYEEVTSQGLEENNADINFDQSHDDLLNTITPDE